MAVFFRIVGEDTFRIWGLGQAQRIARVLAKLRDGTCKPVPLHAEPDESLPEGARILLVRSDYLLDERVIDGLIKKASDNLVVEVDGVPVTAWVTRDRLAVAEKLLSGQAVADAGLQSKSPAEVGSSISRKLRKISPPFALPVSRDNVRHVEHHLFKEAYKGITDLVTKWVWPKPAEQVVRFCASHGIRPNHVTAMSWILAIAAGISFYAGYFGWGLVLGWIMTFLDTVDGKLARVTVDSSQFGHLFDHVLDVVHPPLWYLAWGLGLSQYQPVILEPSVMATFWLLLAAYVGGRLVEGVFKKFVAGFSIFTWKLVDSINRLITARRNPCLIFLTLSLLSGRPDLGYEAVTIWMLFSTLYLLGRLIMAVYQKSRGEPLQSWLDQVEPDRARGSQRWFVSSA